MVSNGRRFTTISSRVTDRRSQVDIFLVVAAEDIVAAAGGRTRDGGQRGGGSTKECGGGRQRSRGGAVGLGFWEGEKRGVAQLQEGGQCRRLDTAKV